MLFVFDPPVVQQVWMAGTTVSLDAGWIARDQLVAVEHLDPCTAADQAVCPRFSSPEAVNSLLEVPAGALTDTPLGTPVVITPR